MNLTCYENPTFVQNQTLKTDTYLYQKTTRMKLYRLPLLLTLSLTLFTFFQPLQAQSSLPKPNGKGLGAKSKVKWTSNPFDHQVFIENGGQFTGPENGDKILYGAQVGDLFVFITPHGLIYKFTQHPEASLSPDKKRLIMADPDDVNWKKARSIDHYVTATWEGSNGASNVVAGEEKTNYYTYPGADGKSTIKVNIFKTLTCLNVYPGIDIKYSFIPGKDGFEYALIVHPGANVSDIQLKYDGTKKMYIDKQGNVQINSGWGTFTDHAPVSFADGDSAARFASSYRLLNNVESFHVTNPDPFRTLVIDPWATNWTTSYAGIGGFTGAYDLDYDYAGNVYIYGAYNPFQLAKYNASGVQIWTYNTTFPNQYFGCFCVDKYTGISFCFEGFGGGGYAYTDKVSTNGALINQKTSGTLDEQWRAAYDLCSHEIAIAGGGISLSLQAATLDTANSTYTSVNVLGLSPGTGYHDLCLVACDPLVDSTYMASTWTYANTKLDNNVLMSFPMPSLSPTGLKTYDGLNFQECASPKYVATGPGNTNGMNGMAISPNWLYTYDGDSLQQIDKGTGAINSKVNVSGTYFNWGGIAVDLCDNIYLGNSDSVDIYDGGSMSYKGSIGAFKGNVFDVVLGNGVLSGHDSILYVCGKGFVSSIEIDPPSPPTIKKSKVFHCSCICSATGLLSFCGNVDTGANATYLWSNGQTTYTATGLCPGNTYTLTVSLGCSQQYTDTFNMPLTDTFHMSFATIDPTCGLCNGSATVTANGGGTPYTYLWTPSNQTTKTATGLCVGTYTVSVTDSCGDITTATVTMTTAGLTINTTINSNDKCNGNCNGSASVTVSGGTSPYTYAWTPSGGKSATATGLCAGTYTISVKDINGCLGTATAVITQPLPITATKTVTNVLCNGGTGSATITASGGTTPYNYFWNPSAQTNATATGLKAATYTVTITDANSCTGSTAVLVTQPVVLTASIATPTYPPCNGGVGSAMASGGGGISPYTYSWSPSAQTTATATGLSAATYTATVKDVNGCTATTSVVITQPTVVKATIAVTYPACNGNKGSATVTATGGTPGYKYLWTPSGQTVAAATGLGVTIYTVTVTDSHGCTGTASINITQPAVLTVTATFNQATCNLANGSATATPAGGTSPYAYSWSPGGQSNANAVGLKAATYTVTVKDNNGCSASTSVTVTQPSAVVATITSVKNAICNGTPTGSATVTASGGTAPYGYIWSPAGGNGATGTGLTAGNYTVTVRDNNGCTTTATTIITQPAAMAVTVTGLPIPCLGHNAVYSATVSGGTGPYNYTWNPGNQSGSSVTLTPPGSVTYTVTVTDANGCQQNGYVSFTFPPPLAVSISGDNVTCSKRTATLCALATGGTGGDIYLWEPINSASPCVTIPTSITTVYTVIVTDNCNVSATASTTVHVQPPPEASFVSSATQGCAPMCVQFHNTTPPTGGKETYVWNFGNGDSLKEEDPIYCFPKEGSYNITLTVVSDSGCSSSLRKADLINVFGKPKAAFTYSPQPVTILSPTVQFTDESTDSYGLAYRWWYFGDSSDSGSHAANPVHTYQDTGTYCATLIEMNEKGCSDTVTNCLIVEPLYNLYIPSAFTPNGDGLNDVFVPVGQYIRDFDMYIFDRWGMEIYHTTDITKGWDGTVYGNGTVSQEDTYIYKITITDAQYNQHSYIGNVTLLK